MIDDCSDDSSDDDGGGGGKWNIMVGRDIDILLGLPVLERNAGGVTSGVKGANKIITETFRSIERAWNFVLTAH